MYEVEIYSLVLHLLSDMEIKTDRLKTFKGYIFQTKQMRNSSLNLPVTLKDYMHSKGRWNLSFVHLVFR